MEKHSLKDYYVKASEALTRRVGKLSRGIKRSRRKETVQVSYQDGLPPFFNLSDDVIYYLIKAIPPADGAALAVTCKAIWFIIGGSPGVRKLIENKKDRVSLLARLEIFFPQHVLCHQCAVFHRRQKLNRHISFQPRPCDEVNRPIKFWDCFYHLPFSLAKEVMNRHRYGKDYGCPISEIGCCAGELGCPEHFRFRRLFGSAKIVNGNLVLQTDQYAVLCGKEGPVLPSANFFHSRNGTFPTLLFSKIRGKRECTFMRCPDCSSEFRLLVDRVEGKNLVRQRITTWINAGACETPYDPQWISAAGCQCAGLRDCHRITPEDSLYLSHYNDRPPSDQKRGFLNLSWRDFRPDPFLFGISF
ncbi:hypothetical protein BDDG_04288 [Blastomyces dermatitidis ATCC 18188]|uniref:F-box domain-containing protein n=1 Tax=Ajellomyces dermatitidis (strain ATCC 18188 / CBS 674.68) TaxID=653446 RepID=F2TDN3_AJEDA|nr:hypothetical protein BDDG_04288 [Blastomyces dermatitidis ATCC 18188]